LIGYVPDDQERRLLWDKVFESFDGYSDHEDEFFDEFLKLKLYYLKLGFESNPLFI